MTLKKSTSLSAGKPREKQRQESKSFCTLYIFLRLVFALTLFRLDLAGTLVFSSAPLVSCSIVSMPHRTLKGGLSSTTGIVGPGAGAVRILSTLRVTHIVLDEVHERSSCRFSADVLPLHHALATCSIHTMLGRSLHTDFLLTILRELLHRRRDLKLVLMPRA